jgi:transcription elongation factor GreA
MAEPVLLTKEGKEELEKELKVLVTEKRVEIADRIKVARDFGDLSENAEYDAAKNEQARIEARILEIETMLKYAQIISESGKVKGVISLGSTVVVYDKDYDEEMTFKIVGTTEADVTDGKISNESPIGNALLNRKVGEEVEIATPDGTTTLVIKKVQ